MLQTIGTTGLAATAMVGLGGAAQASAAAGTVGTFWDQGGQVFNVMAYGATGNGTTDDTLAITSAISAAQGAGGGVVYLPQGDYLISSTLTITKGGTQIVGSGQNATRIKPSSSFLTGDVIAFSSMTGGSVRMLTIVGAAARTSGAAIHMATANEIYVQDVDLTNMYVGCQIDGTCILNYIDRGYWTDFSAGGTAIFVNTTGNDQYISNIVCSGGTGHAANLRISATGALWCHQCDFIGAENGLVIDTPEGSAITWCFFTDCAWDTCGDRCMLINPASGATVRGLNFENCWSSSAQNYDGCYIGGPVDGVQFVAHRFFNNGANGLIVYGPASNVFVDASGSSGNGLAHSGSAGMAFTGSCNGFAVRNCRVGPYAGFGTAGQTNGILVISGCDNYIITGNNTQGNATGISNGGGPTSVVTNNL